MNIEVLDPSATLKKLSQKRDSVSSDYYAMYSTWLGGITTDPSLMLVPVDDHIVHRGDGIFEAFRIFNGRAYDMHPHLERLKRSAQLISLELPYTLDEIAEICQQTIAASKQQQAIARLYVSRGPGDFTPNPYSTLGAQLYLIITRYVAVDESKYQNGGSAQLSKFVTKPDFFSQVKSCNYLPNVLMKKEAVDAGVDYSIALTPQENIAEGPTENFAIISQDEVFVVPSFDYTLRGITLSKVMQLAQSLVDAGDIRGIETRHLKPEDILSAKECFVTGTTQQVLPIVEFEGQAIGTGRVGNISKKLRELLQQDMVEHTH